MEVICTQKFGPHEVGDIVELPDDSEYSPLYFAEKPKSQSKAKASKRAKESAEAADENADPAEEAVVNPKADDEAASTENDVEKNEDE